MPLPDDWTPPARMQRVICHWTAGTYKATDFDKQHYHLLIEADGAVVRGKPSIALNQSPVRSGYAAHTLNCNGGSVGVSLCCMGGSDVRESPFNPGRYPMTEKQWVVLVGVVADLCIVYEIPVSPTTVLSHAEVQSNLGITQRGKWDYTRLAFDLSVVGAKACGDKLRSEVFARLKPPTDPEPIEPSTPNVPLPDAVEMGRVAASTLNFRRTPNGVITGSLPRGVVLRIHARDGDWLNVTTPAGYTGWVHGGYVEKMV